MSGFKKFAVAGAGNLRRYIIEELLKLKQSGAAGSVSVLSRLSSALSGTEVVISTLGGVSTLQNEQTVLAEAAKHAGVRLFVPSEFGTLTKDLKEGLFPYFDWDLPNGKVTIQGEGNAPGDRTTLNELADAYQAKSGKKLDLSHMSKVELRAALRKDSEDLASLALFLSLQLDEGFCIARKPEELDNHLFPSWNPTKAVDALLGQ
ncbi:hypothetical protein GLOTRDRAFT_115386 [Gloeophyllum trabeum ATCC 11539]|uniref:NmrA-like domain-containing protein n=1 Tax=Gloeophyllum trabeum (strain ATCC 11539 / FP-39264 / Madison 617) TaxID=670483 RepID=S7RVY8_GLOTA|nr:uncharacterized protein GLOTRDRAFT_115386 [Gloeophyllum trabeum ATCC 11539]EPQ57454.1 hypothetical protein GLOTRDRAFT_115386 [Gloeophyllum trabeum ATCC 11539]